MRVVPPSHVGQHVARVRVDHESRTLEISGHLPRSRLELAVLRVAVFRPGLNPSEVRLQASLRPVLGIPVDGGVDPESAPRHRLDPHLLQRDVIHDLVEVRLTLSQGLGIHHHRLAGEFHPFRLRDHLLGEHPVENVISCLAVLRPVGEGGDLGGILHTGHQRGALLDGEIHGLLPEIAQRSGSHPIVAMAEGDAVEVILQHHPLHPRLALPFIRIVRHDRVHEVPFDTQGQESLHDLALDAGLSARLHLGFQVKCVACQLHRDRTRTLGHRPRLQVEPDRPCHPDLVHSVVLEETLVLLCDEGINQFLGHFLDGYLAAVFHEHAPDFPALVVHDQARDLDVIDGRNVDLGGLLLVGLEAFIGFAQAHHPRRHAEQKKDPQPFALVKTTLPSVFLFLFRHGIGGSKPAL